MAMVQCPDCDIVSTTWGSSDGNCSTCHGTGRANILLQALASATGEQADCDDCNGSGKCQTCGGSGEVESSDEEE